MIGSITGSMIKGSYQDSALKTKEQTKAMSTITKQGDTSRIEELKASIESGNYRIDIEALAKRIAQELM